MYRQTLQQVAPHIQKVRFEIRARATKSLDATTHRTMHALVRCMSQRRWWYLASLQLGRRDRLLRKWSGHPCQSGLATLFRCGSDFARAPYLFRAMNGRGRWAVRGPSLRRRRQQLTRASAEAHGETVAAAGAGEDHSVSILQPCAGS